MIERKEKCYLSCPWCSKVLFKYDGICSIEVKCSKCNKELIAFIEGSQQTVMENRRMSADRKSRDIKRLSMYTNAS